MFGQLYLTATNSCSKMNISVGTYQALPQNGPFIATETYSALMEAQDYSFQFRDYHDVQFPSGLILRKDDLRKYGMCSLQIGRVELIFRVSMFQSFNLLLP